MLSEAQISTYGPFWTRQRLADKFYKQRKIIEKLCAPLTGEDYLISSTKDTSPPKWHLAHTSWFFEHFILEPYEKAFIPFDPSYEYLFNSYYRSVGEFLPKTKRNQLSRPTLDQVFEYREYVNSHVSDLIENCSESIFQRIAKLVELGMEHEQQHQELLLMDIKQNFFESPIRPVYHENVISPASLTDSSPEAKFISFPAGLIEIGNQSDSFHYDNETNRHRVWLESFQLSSLLVKNQEYLEFIEAGGYEDPHYWLSDGWEARQKHNWKMPLYWEKNGNEYSIMTLSGTLPLQALEPVCHISYYEAQAYAKFREARLPTEAEWEYASTLEPIRGNFLEDQRFHPVPQDQLSGEVFPDIHGGLWEWTQSAYLPYPGYQAYDQELFEYNSKFMCNQFVLRGGSCITPKSHYRHTYRNFYYPDMRWQFSGLRLAKDEK